MRTLRVLPSLLLLAPIALAGCTSVTGGRPGVPSQIRSLTSIGDRPYPVETGEPGAKVVAEDDDRPAGRVLAERSISGRVLDAEGAPVPNAEVRVAVGGSGTGRAVAVATDEAGRFTLANLRDDTDYTLIAESEDDQGEIRSGRERVRAPRCASRSSWLTTSRPDLAAPWARSRAGRPSPTTTPHSRPPPPRPVPSRSSMRMTCPRARGGVVREVPHRACAGGRARRRPEQ